MQWLYLLLAVAALAVAFKTTSVALLLVCLVASLALGIVMVSTPSLRAAVTFASSIGQGRSAS